MKPEDSFARLARRDAELHELAVRGRRRSLRLMLLGFVPAPFLVMYLNHDSSLSAVFPILIVCVVSGTYSWRKWQQRPEDTQSIAFMGLDRRTRWSTYRSILRGRSIQDPVVFTMIETMHEHVRHAWAMVVLTIVAVATSTIVLIQVGGGGAAWVSIAIGGLCLLGIATVLWLIRQVGVVLDRSHAEHA